MEGMSAESSTELPFEIIVLNGASSSGKTTLAVALQDILDETWLILGIDTLISALPLTLLDIHEDATIGARPRVHEVRDGGIRFDADGEITVGAEFRRLDESWRTGLASIAATGTRLILDEVFLDGSRSQDRLRRCFADRKVAWIGVTCDAEVALERERDRGDRVVGAFERQSIRVHEGVHYDLVVDTTSRPTHVIARQIAAHLRGSLTQ
jgi:chloramphenicol 3-O phosphotransferase